MIVKLIMLSLYRQNNSKKNAFLSILESTETFLETRYFWLNKIIMIEWNHLK